MLREQPEEINMEEYAGFLPPARRKSFVPLLISFQLRTMAVPSSSSGPASVVCSRWRQRLVHAASRPWSLPAYSTHERATPARQ